MGLRVCPVKAFIARSRTHSRGATVMALRDAFYGLKEQWEVENHSVAPDIEVMMDPKAVREGHDPQLEKAVETVMEMLKQHPLPEYPKPAYPNYHPVMPPLP